MTEAGYIAIGCCYAQILLMKQTMEDVGLQFEKVAVYGNTNAVSC